MQITAMQKYPTFFLAVKTAKPFFSSTIVERAQPPNHHNNNIYHFRLPGAQPNSTLIIIILDVITKAFLSTLGSILLGAPPIT